MLAITFIIEIRVPWGRGENHGVGRNPHMGVFGGVDRESTDVPISPGGLLREARTVRVFPSLTSLRDLVPPVGKVSLMSLPSAAHYPAPLGNWGCRARVELEF